MDVCRFGSCLLAKRGGATTERRLSLPLVIAYPTEIYGTVV